MVIYASHTIASPCLPLCLAAYFHSVDTGETSWEHPTDAHFKELYRRIKGQEEASIKAAEIAVLSLARSAGSAAGGDFNPASSAAQSAGVAAASGASEGGTEGRHAIQGAIVGDERAESARNSVESSPKSISRYAVDPQTVCCTEYLLSDELEDWRACRLIAIVQVYPQQHTTIVVTICDNSQQARAATNNHQERAGDSV
jgi:hypothetical protein